MGKICSFWIRIMYSEDFRNSPAEMAINNPQRHARSFGHLHFKAAS